MFGLLFAIIYKNNIVNCYIVAPENCTHIFEFLHYLRPICDYILRGKEDLHIGYLEMDKDPV